MSELLLVSDRMLPKRLLEEGFGFAIPTSPVPWIDHATIKIGGSATRRS